MAIELATNLRQLGRKGTVSTDAFFPLIESQDVNFAVEKVLSAGKELNTPLVIGHKYIRAGSIYQPTPMGSSDGDVVRYTGIPNEEWELYLDVSNSETNYGIVFDRETRRFLQYETTTNSWIAMLKSGSVDGGTFA